MIGFTTTDLSFSSIRTYIWQQRTEPASLVVVCDYIFEANKIVLASSYNYYITLNPVIFPVSAFAQISAYQYLEVGSSIEGNYYVQDIGMSQINDFENPLISVAGYCTRETSPVRSFAWHGSVRGISTSIPMTNNNYFGQVGDFWEHHKIRYDQMGKTFTGGHSQGILNGIFSESALFGSPLEFAPDCDHLYKSELPVNNPRQWSSFGLVQNDFEEQILDNFLSFLYPMDYDECPDFKGGSAPEFAILAPEKESEITVFYDHISIKDIPAGINYQIYSVTGQLIQTGTTNPDITTAQLSKGMYILRLETGKALKFVK